MNQFGKKMALVAVTGMIAGLAACGGSQPAADTQATPAGDDKAQKSCSGEKKCSANGSCSGAKDAPAGSAAPADTAAPAAAPK
jgi:hypothetical protein